MPYNRIERRMAALLDAVPGLRAVAKAGYQRFNYLLHGGRQALLALDARVSIAQADGEGAASAAATECFFGYFGMQPWSADGRRYLFHRWRPADGSSQVAICVRDLATGEVRVIGDSRAWNFQQGAMAQWLDRDGAQCVVFNDAIDRRLVCRIVAPDGTEIRHPWPIQALHPNAQEALCLNYRRLARIRPEYGYAVEVDNFSPDQPAERDGLWRADLRSGDGELVIPLAALARLDPRPDMDGADHKVNHAVYSPSGARFVFMHRWIGRAGKFSRLYLANADGSGLRLLLDHRMVSHYAWRDERTLLAWARAPEEGDRYYVLDVDGGTRAALCPGVLDRFGDGHPSFSPDGHWLVTDSYPDRARMRRLLLCRPDRGLVLEAGSFFSPWRYDGAVRCDLHPRWSRDGRAVSIDSAHEGLRRTYFVDVGRLLDEGARPA